MSTIPKIFYNFINFYIVTINIKNISTIEKSTAENNEDNFKISEEIKTVKPNYTKSHSIPSNFT